MFIIRPFLPSDAEAVHRFTEQHIGKGYYSVDELIDHQKKSATQEGEITSFLLVETETNEIKGIRLAFPPGSWTHGKGSKLRPDLWPFSLHKAAYFQSLFLAPDVQGQGWGPLLSKKAIDIFSKLKASGIITHCWKEAPNNSSFRYLDKVGFKLVIEYPLYWFDVDYFCTRDGKPCRCTAIEMYLQL